MSYKDELTKENWLALAISILSEKASSEALSIMGIGDESLKRLEVKKI